MSETVSIYVSAIVQAKQSINGPFGGVPSFIRDGSHKMSTNLVSHGILSRTVRDTAAFYAGAEQYFFNPQLPGIGLVENPGKKRLRIALITNPPNFSPENVSCINQAIKIGKVCEGLGHKVEEIPFPFHTQVMDDFFIYWAAMAFSFYHFGEKIVGSPINKDKLEKFTLGLSRYYRNNILKIQFAAAYGQEKRLIELALELEEARPWPRVGGQTSRGRGYQFIRSHF